MRQGELIALTWGDVDLGEAKIHVRRSFTDGTLGPTKNRQKRPVDLNEDVVEMLGRWWGELGSPGDDALVFPGATKSGYMPDVKLRKELYAAMERAEILRVGAGSPEPRVFHSLRHTHARIWLQQNLSMFELSRRLGHSSLSVTSETYGHIEAKARKAAVAELEGVLCGPLLLRADARYSRRGNATAVQELHQSQPQVPTRHREDRRERSDERRPGNQLQAQQQAVPTGDVLQPRPRPRQGRHRLREAVAVLGRALA
jgi:Phage integrase family